jgi:hypothetical protein
MKKYSAKVKDFLHFDVKKRHEFCLNLVIIVDKKRIRKKNTHEMNIKKLPNHETNDIMKKRVNCKLEFVMMNKKAK